MTSERQKRECIIIATSSVMFPYYAITKDNLQCSLQRYCEVSPYSMVVAGGKGLESSSRVESYFFVVIDVFIIEWLY